MMRLSIMFHRKLLITLLFISAFFLQLKAQEAKLHVSGRGNKMVIKTNTGFTSFNVEMRGRIELTDDDQDIKNMSPDGYLEIKKTVFGSRRSLIVTPDEDGLKKEYYEGRTKVPFEPKGREWMGEILPELVRSTTIGAESRVNRFFRKGGPAAVLSEIDRMGSNYVKAHYADLLVKKPLKSSDYVRIIDRISDTINSNYYLSEFLRGNLKTFLKSRETLEAVFQAANRIDSDHYKTEIIKAGLKDQSVSIESVKIILRAAGNINSNHYKTEVLSSLMRQELEDVIVSEIINTSRSISSDHYRSVVLNKALNHKDISALSFERVLESVKDIRSDHYKSEVLRNLLDNPLPKETQQKLIDITNSIDSDHYTSEVLRDMLENQDLDDQVFGALVKRAGEIDSDHYASTVMEIALSTDPSDSKIIKLLQAAEEIESDHYLTEVLVAAAPKIRESDASVKDIYRNTAKGIRSETYYGRAMRALDR